jgi:predicted flavoprotein YhiN
MTQARHPQPNLHDVIILGAGAAGLMCASVAGQRGRSVLVLEQARHPGEKIRISGGGRCNS